MPRQIMYRVKPKSEYRSKSDMFSIQTVFQGIDHITDAMGVCMTLLHGNRQALLFDTGYGTEDVSQVMSPYGAEQRRF